MFTTFANERLAQQRATEIAREAELMRRRTERAAALGPIPTASRTRSGLLASFVHTLRRPYAVAR